MAAIDRVIGAAVDSVKKSGVLEAGALMAIVSMVNSDGTVTVTRGDDTYPKVRRLSGYTGPAVGDVVEILRTSGGWVAIGRFLTETNGWVSITPAAGYTNNGNSNGNMMYRKVVDHGTPFVEWSGGISWSTSGSPPSGGQFYTMPAALRPTTQRSVSAAAGGVCTKIDFRTAGECVLIGPSGITTWASVNGVRYRID